MPSHGDQLRKLLINHLLRARIGVTKLESLQFRFWAFRVGAQKQAKPDWKAFYRERLMAAVAEGHYFGVNEENGVSLCINVLTDEETMSLDSNIWEKSLDNFL